MALRTWLALGVIVAAIAVGCVAASWSHPAALRSEHSRPAVRVPSRMVAVTPEGKTFHDPSCRYIHGPVQMLPAADAVAKGYTPCTRCMREALTTP